MLRIFLVCSIIMLTLLSMAYSVMPMDVVPRGIPSTPLPTNSPFDYILIIVLENKNITEIMGNPSAPYENQLASDYGLLSHYTALTHPSLPNYLALLGGSTFGVTDDDGPSSHPINSPAIVDRVESAGLTWKAYMEDMPEPCYASDSGLYSDHHNPFVYFTSITGDAARCNSHVVPANSGGAGLPDDNLVNDLASTSTASNFMWLTPNKCNDMHSCPISTGDNYLSQLVPQILDSHIFKTQKAALFLTFDEGRSSSLYPTDYVYTIWAGPVAKTHFTSSLQYTHYSLLRTIEAAWGLPPLTSNDSTAASMSEFFTSFQEDNQLKASFTHAPAAPLAGQPVKFTATAAGGKAPYIFNWTFGDSSTGTGDLATHIYNAKGSFTVTLIAEDSSSPLQTATASHTVPIGPTPLTANFTISGIPTVGGPLTFTASAFGGTSPFTFSWRFGDGGTRLGASVVHTYQAAGTHIVVLATSDSGGQSIMSSETLIVTALLSADFAYTPSNPSAQDTVSFTASAAGGAQPYSFSWSFSDGGTASGATTTHAYEASGTYIVTLSATDTSERNTQVSKSVTVSAPRPSPLSTSLTYYPTEPTSSVSVSFSASASGGTSPYTFAWTFEDGKTVGASVTHTFQVAGVYTVTLNTTDAGGQTGSDSENITVISPVSASLSYTPSNPSVGILVFFLATVAGGNPPYITNWSLGDGAIATGSSVPHTFQSSGNYTVTLTASDSRGQPAEASKTIAVSAVLSTSFTYSPSTPSAQDTVLFTAGTTGGTQPYNFNWDFGDGPSENGASVSLHEYSLSEIYQVTLIVTDDAGALASATRQIQILPELTATLSLGLAEGAVPMSVPFQVQVSGGQAPYTFLWDFGDGQISTDPSPVHTYTIAATYQARVAVGDSLGHTVSTSRVITVTTGVPSRVGPLNAQYVLYGAGASGLALLILSLITVYRRRRTTPATVRKSNRVGR